MSFLAVANSRSDSFLETVGPAEQVVCQICHCGRERRTKIHDS